MSKKIEITRYEIVSKKIPPEFDGFKIAHVSDFHSRPEEGAAEIIAAEMPDITAVTGDILHDDDSDTGRAARLMRALCEVSPVYFVTGNHDVRRPGCSRIFQKEFCGAVLLDNSSTFLEKDGAKIALCGVGDPFSKLPERISQNIGEAFSALMQSAPEPQRALALTSPMPQTAPTVGSGPAPASAVSSSATPQTIPTSAPRTVSTAVPQTTLTAAPSGAPQLISQTVPQTTLQTAPRTTARTTPQTAALSPTTAPQPAPTAVSLSGYDGFKILLFHRANLFDEIKTYPFDLILSGHMHGGQIRLPYLGGVLAPLSSALSHRRMIFPQYTAGRVDSNGKTMIINRGLSNTLPFPRFGNPCEVGIITLVCAD